MNPDAMLQQVLEVLEANRQRPKAVRTFEAVLRLLDRGRDHLKVWENLRDLVHSDAALADLAISFFVLSGVAHLEVATLTAANLTDTQGDSTNITFLLNLIQADRKKTFLRHDWLKAKPVVESARLRLHKIGDVVLRIKERRDRELAHLDRRNIDLSPDWQAIEVDDLRQVFDVIDAICQELAASINAFAEISRFSFDDASPHGLKDLIYFTRAGFNDDLVVSPSPRAEAIRNFDRSLRQVKAELEAPHRESPLNGLTD
jgi:hypothetical protein